MLHNILRNKSNCRIRRGPINPDQAHVEIILGKNQNDAAAASVAGARCIQ